MLGSMAKKATVLVSFVLLMSVPAVSQQEIEPLVVVPEHPGGVAVNGCFRATQDLFGPYRLTFCLERRGTYQVRGGGLRCDGGLTRRVVGRDIIVDLQRSSCGRGRAWDAATMECHHTGGLLRRLVVPQLSNLRCTYFPSVRGISPRTFMARRL